MRKHLLILAFVLLPAASVFAVPVIDFGTGIAGQGGTITIAGGQASGSGILIDTMLAAGTPVTGVFNVDGTGSGAAGPTGVLNFNTATGSIQIIGSVPSLGIVSPVTLLSGTISSFMLGPAAITAFGPDTKNSALLTALGLPTTTQFAFYGFSIGMASNTPNTFNAISTDIANTAIPEPTSMLLLGSGLLALAGISRLRRK